MFGFGVLLPWALMGLPLAAGLLIYIYRERGKADRILVGTTLLLSEFSARAVAKRKFVPPLRFFLELLALALIVFGIAGLYDKSTSQHVVVLLDNSLSMAALNHAVQPAEQRLAWAKQTAQTALLELADSAKVDIFVVAPKFHALNVQPLSPVQAGQAINAVKIGYGEAGLESAILRLLEDESVDQVKVLTDQTWVKPQEKSETLLRRLAVITAPVGDLEKPLQNIAIASIKSKSGGAQAVHAELKNFGLSAVALEVKLEGAENAPEAAGAPLAGKLVEWKEIAGRSLKLGAASSAELAFEQGLGGYKAVRLKLNVSSLNPEAYNVIVQDDGAWAVFEDQAPESILVSDLSPQELHLDALSLLNFKQVRPAEYAAFIAANPKLNTVIFHRFVPQTLPAANFLAVMPPAGNSVLPVAPEHKDAAITRWEATHPVLSYLNLPLLKLKILQPLILPPWGQELIVSTSGVAAYAGEREGGRALVVGTEIFPYEGKKSPLLSIFTLNALKWLSNANVEQGYRPVNTTLEAGSGVSLVDSLAEEPLGPILPEVGASEQPASALVALSSPGLYLVRAADGQNKFVAVNFFNAGESDTLSRKKFELSEIPGTRSSKAAVLALYQPLAFWAGIVLLLCVLWQIFGEPAFRRKG